jgi:hypothetical protein
MEMSSFSSTFLNMFLTVYNKINLSETNNFNIIYDFDQF